MPAGQAVRDGEAEHGCMAEARESRAELAQKMSPPPVETAHLVVGEQVETTPRNSALASGSAWLRFGLGGDATGDWRDPFVFTAPARMYDIFLP